jgi:hypothetical protein
VLLAELTHLAFNYSRGFVLQADRGIKKDLTDIEQQFRIPFFKYAGVVDTFQWGDEKRRAVTRSSNPFLGLQTDVLRQHIAEKVDQWSHGVLAFLRSVRAKLGSRDVLEVELV